MKLAKSLTLFFSLTLLIFTFACDGGGGSSDSGGTGTLAVSLTDSAGSYKAVYITVESLEVHTGGNDNNKENWQTIEMDKEKDTINLCELTNGVFEYLGSIRLDADRYTQMRLHLSDTPEDTDELNILSEMHPHANYVILEDNTVHELKVPSGFQSGVKIVKGFRINDNGTTEIILDFDAMKSVVEAGNSGQWLLKPTIKVGELNEFSIINGTVLDGSGAVIPNAYVSAQKYNGYADYDEDKVVIQAGTITDQDGEFSLFVKPDTYNIVAYLDGMEFDYETIQTDPDDVINGVVFELLEATTKGTIEGTVSINGGDDNEQYATISYRKEVNCNQSDCEMIEIISKNLKRTTDPFEIELPIIDSDVSYQRVASSFGYKTETKILELIANDTFTDYIELTD